MSVFIESVKKYADYPPLRSGRYHALACLVLSLLLFLPPIIHTKPITPFADSVAYLSIAADLHDTGIFADGNFRHLSAVTGPKGQGMFFGPLYPAFLTVLMQFDPGLYDMAVCVEHGDSQSNDQCPLGYTLLLSVQGLITCLSYFLVWWAGYVLTGRKAAGWIAFILVAATGKYMDFGTIVMTEVLTFPLFTLSTTFGALAWREKSWRLMAAAGFFWGLLSLNRPNYPYGLYVTVALAIPFALYHWKRRSDRTGAVLLTALVCGYLLAAGPWIARNAATLGVADISRGYSGFILSQRVAYNDMTAREWGASFLYGMPHMGRSKWAARLVDPDYFRRFSFDKPYGFYYYGNNTIQPESLRIAGSPAAQQSYLIRHYIVAHPVKHMLTTLSIAWRGMWVAGNWTLLTLPGLIWALFSAAKRRDWTLFLFAWPGYVMLGFNAFTSVNIPRYNLVMMPCLATGMAIALIALFNYCRTRFKPGIAETAPC